MKKKDGLIALRKQKAKLSNAQYFKDETWVFQTASYVKEIFGEDSLELDFISKFSFGAYFNTGASDEEKRRHLDGLKLKADRFIDNCIETLDIKGIYKRESKYKKWLTDPENWWKVLSFLVTTLVAIAGIIYVAK